MKQFDYAMVKDPEYFRDGRLDAHSDHVYYASDLVQQRQRKAGDKKYCRQNGRQSGQKVAGAAGAQNAVGTAAAAQTVQCAAAGALHQNDTDQKDGYQQMDDQ